MANKKSFRSRGKIKLSEYFKKFKEGDIVCVIREKSVRCAFPKRILGKTGTIIQQRGEYYVIRLNDLNKEKIFIIHPIHLKQIIDKKEVKVKKKVGDKKK